jgi:hypothetical protein
VRYLFSENQEYPDGKIFSVAIIMKPGALPRLGAVLVYLELFFEIEL